ncbi:MAG: disulfide bond formation protein B [bacterium]|nr:disulfide bond formation protein B [bacterium]
MSELIQSALPYLVLFSHALFVLLVLALVYRKSWGVAIAGFMGKYAVHFAFLVSLGAVLASLFYSQIVGFEPCVLCWWQRVFLFPLPLIFGMALWKKDPSSFRYAIPLVIIAGLIASYQSYTSLGGASLLPCTAAEGACSRIYVREFGYITIPLMSLTVSLYILLTAWSHRINENNHS